MFQNRLSPEDGITCVLLLNLPKIDIILDNMTVQIESLKTIAYFSGLSSTELNSVRKFVFEKAVAEAEIIQFEGEPARALYFIVSGLGKVFKTSAEGKEQVLYFVRPGDSFNDVSAFEDSLSLTSVETMMPVVLYGVKKGDLEVILREYPQIALNMLKTLSRRVKHLVSLVEDLSFRSVTNRVAKILLEYAGDGIDHKPRLTQQEMAAIAGTAREMVGRSLKTLKDEGTIKLDRNRIIITDKEALREMARIAT